MSSYLYRYSAGELVQKNSAFVAQLLNTDNVYLLPNESADGALVGEWDNSGTLVFVDDGVYVELRPFGNEEINLYDEFGGVIGTKTGVATDNLDLIHYQGHSQRKLQNEATAVALPEYPSDNQPFKIRITRTLTTDDAWPHIPWGWLVEVLAEDPVRVITARGIGIYNSDGGYLYTTGSFILTDFEELDENGDPITVQRYATECPIGQRQATATPIYFKLLFGSLPEGSWQLEALEEGAMQERLFWAEDQ